MSELISGRGRAGGKPDEALKVIGFRFYCDGSGKTDMSFEQRINMI